jgi:hypothetical protein
MTRPTPGVQFADNISAPEVFSTGAAGFGLLFGNVVITFESAKYDHSEPPGPITRAVNLRLVLPTQAAQALVLGLNDYLVKQGLDPTAAAKAGATAQ